MLKKASATPKAVARPSPSPRPLPASQPKTSSARALKRPVPAASVAKAKKAFKGFSLSKFAGNPIPANHVAAGQSPVEVQRRLISTHIENLNHADTPTRAMRVALTDTTIRQLLPSFNVEDGTVDLGEVMGVIQQNMRGTEF